MHVHEYLAKELLSRRGLIIPDGRVVDTPDSASIAAWQVGTPETCIKAQVRAGDRARHGGVRFARTPDEARQAATELLGSMLRTSQTLAGGLKVNWLYVENKVDVVEEFYAAVTLDRTAGRLVALAGPAFTDERDAEVERAPIVLARGKPRFDAMALATRVAKGLLSPDALADVLDVLVRAAIDLDATLVEVHPLGVTRDGRPVVLDAKMTIDDNALHRHPEFAKLREIEMEEDGQGLELSADRNRINFIGFDGDIGVIVNGAGLALATLDMISDLGGRPANFMDIRTTAATIDIAHGVKLVLDNPATKVLLVNVHGGGMQRCDTIVEGLAIALRNSARKLPLVVRLAGQNADYARQRLANFRRDFIDCGDMGEAVRAAVAAVPR